MLKTIAIRVALGIFKLKVKIIYYKRRTEKKIIKIKTEE